VASFECWTCLCIYYLVREERPWLFCFRHYKQGYGHLLELRMHDTNILEIKTIAGYIDYKVSVEIVVLTTDFLPIFAYPSRVYMFQNVYSFQSYWPIAVKYCCTYAYFVLSTVLCCLSYRRCMTFLLTQATLLCELEVKRQHSKLQLCIHIYVLGQCLSDLDPLMTFIAVWTSSVISLLELKQKNCLTEELSHRRIVSQKNCLTEELSHRRIVSQKNCLTEELSHRRIVSQKLKYNSISLLCI